MGALLGITLTSCASSLFGGGDHRLYEGPPLPLSEVAIVSSRGGTDLRLMTIDDKRGPGNFGYGSGWDAGFKIELLPGVHRLTFGYVKSLSLQSSLQSTEDITVIFLAEPGMLYWATLAETENTWGPLVIPAGPIPATFKRPSDKNADVREAAMRKALGEEARRAEAQRQAVEKAFLSNGDGTVTDSRSGLMWAAKDNGSDIAWEHAKRYCESYRSGGYSDWRMPTIDELQSLYDPASAQPVNSIGAWVHVVMKIDLTGHWVWSSETQWAGASAARTADFSHGGAYTLTRPYSDFGRALPVRSQGSPVSADGIVTKTSTSPNSRFTDNGMVSNAKTGLMWADQDNGSDITWDDAKRYCEDRRAGGYSDWRMPTIGELQTLYDSSVSQPVCDGRVVHLTPMIHLTCIIVWSSETQGSSDARLFLFHQGRAASVTRSGQAFFRALPVRTLNPPESK